MSTRPLIIFGLLTIVLVATLAWYFSTNPPSIAINDDAIEFGTVAPNELVWREVEIRNLGRQPLVISDVQLSCGCAQVSLSSQTIQKNKPEKMRIAVRGYLVPRVSEETVLLETNDPDDRFIKLSFTFQSERHYLTSPASIDFGRIQNSRLPVEQSAKILENSGNSATGSNWKIYCPNDDIDVSISEEQNQPNHKLSVRLLSSHPIGPVSSAIHVTDASDQSFVVSVQGMVIGPVYSQPPSMVIGPLDPKMSLEDRFITIKHRNDKNSQSRLV